MFVKLYPNALKASFTLKQEISIGNVWRSIDITYILQDVPMKSQKNILTMLQSSYLMPSGFF